MAAVAQRAIERLDGRIASALDGAADSLDGVRRLAWAYFEFFLQERESYDRHIQYEETAYHYRKSDQGESAGPYGKAYRETVARRDETIHRLLERGMASGEIETRLEPHQLLLVIWGQCAGTLRVIAAREEVLGSAYSTSATELFESFVDQAGFKGSVIGLNLIRRELDVRRNIVIPIRRFERRASWLQVLALAGLGLLACRAPEEPTSHGSVREDTHRRLTASLQQALDSIRVDAHAGDECLPGATAAAVLPDELVVEVATGYSSVEQQTPMRPEHVMPAGSVGKVFVAATVLTLVADGRLQLDAPISDWLGEEDWFDRLPNGSSITVRHLLQHASGLIDHAFESEEFVEVIGELIQSGDPDDYLPPERLVQLVLDREPLFEAGNGYHYTDTGYILLGMLVERVAGTSYYELMSEVIIDRLGLERTTPQNRRDPDDLAQGYAIEGRALGLPDEVVGSDGALVFNPLTEWTGGGLYSNPVDLARFVFALMRGEVVDDEALAEMTTLNPASVDDGAGGYGLGLGRRVSSEHGVSYGHSGFFPGYNTRVAYLPRAGLALAVQVNCDSANLDRHFPVLVGAVTDVLTSESARSSDGTPGG